MAENDLDEAKKLSNLEKVHPEEITLDDAPVAKAKRNDEKKKEPVPKPAPPSSGTF